MNAGHNIDIELLPKTTREIVEVIGLPSTILMVEHYGGTELWVPEKIDRNHDLAKTIGLESAAKLCHHFSREKLLIDKCESAMNAIRNAEIVRRYQSGDTAKSLGKEFNLHERMIWYILSDTPKDSNQIHLF
ncbi:MAG: hypothetical protein GKR93_12065 [Gammaproteobacteria bacterium]|nr:hypothetical protein [Gammaproteobacteria bacterium]